MCLLIAIEGIDGSGKGTQAALLKDHFLAEGYRTALLSFPRYQQSLFGKKIGDFLNGRFGSLESVHPLLVSLLFAGDRYESRDLIEQTMSSHDIVICDRYVASNMAHQGAKVAESEQQELLDWIEQLEYTIYKLPPAQLTLFLDVPVENAQELIAAKSRRSYTDKVADLQEADSQYLQRVRDVYARLATRPGWRSVSCIKAGVVRPVEEILAEIVAVVRSANVISI